MIKHGVSIKLLQPQILLGYIIVKGIFQKHGYPCMITSGEDGKHSPNSFHYKGQAIDIRSRWVDSDRRIALLKECQEALGSNYDMVLEKDHYHLEYDPD